MDLPGTGQEEKRDLEGHTGNIQHRNEILPLTPFSKPDSPYRPSREERGKRGPSFTQCSYISGDE